MQLSSDRRYRFAAGAPAVWDALAATDHYQRWWPWLRGFDAGGLVAGDSWRCEVRPPLPYTLRFVIDLHEVVRPELVTATVSGDITGEARLDFEDDGDGCAIRLTSTLAPAVARSGSWRRWPGRSCGAVTTGCSTPAPPSSPPRPSADDHPSVWSRPRVSCGEAPKQTLGQRQRVPATATAHALDS